MTLKWNGDEVKRKIREITPKVLEVGAIVIHGQVVMDTPVDTGLLKNSLSYSIESRQEGLNSDPGDVKADPSDGVPINASSDEIWIGTNVDYAGYIEMGTSRMEAQPFFSTGFAHSKNKAKKAMQESFKNLMKE